MVEYFARAVDPGSIRRIEALAQANGIPIFRRNGHMPDNLPSQNYVMFAEDATRKIYAVEILLSSELAELANDFRRYVRRP